MKKNLRKFGSGILLILLIISMVSGLIISSTFGELEFYELSISSDNSYYLKGETGQIIIQSNASTAYNLKIYDPSDVVVYDKGRSTNSSGYDILSFPVSQLADCGDYRAVASIGELLSTCWFSVPDVENWVHTSFPFQKEHKNLNYQIFGNKTLVITSQADEQIRVTLPDLPSGVAVNCFNTDDVFVARFRHEGIGLAIDMSFIYIYKGAKLLINGTFDSPRDFSFEFASPRQIRKALNNLRDGNLVFDWSDLVRYSHHFSYDQISRRLTVTDLPQTFSIDPYIFEDGFESGDFSAWTSTQHTAQETITVESTDPHSGTYHAYSTTVGDSGTQNCFARKDFGSSYAELYARLYFKLVTNDVTTGDQLYLIDMENQTNGVISRIGLFNNAGTKKLIHRTLVGGSMTSYTSNFEWSLDTWYCLEVYLKIDGSAGIVTVYVDGNPEINTTGIDTDDNGNIDRFECGVCFTNNADNVYLRFDNVIVDDEFIGCEDTIPPTYSNLLEGATNAGSYCLFNATFNDNLALESNGQYQFGTNNTGTWVWDSAVNFSSTPQEIEVGKTLNSTVGLVVSYQWNFTDNAGNSNTTGIQSFTLTDGDYPTYSDVSHSTTTAGQLCYFNITVDDNYKLEPSGYWLFFTNNTGTFESLYPSAINFTQTPETISANLTLNSTVGLVIAYQWGLWDHTGWENDTEIFYLTTTEYKFNVTWQFNTGGSFYMNWTALTNSSIIEYSNGTMFILAGITTNSSYVWLNFTWTGGSYTTNIYNLTLYSESTVWCYFGEAGTGDVEAARQQYFAGLVIGVPIFLICIVLIGFVIIRRR